MGKVREMPPRGHYLAHEVGWLAGVSAHRIGQWARRGYIRPSQKRGRPHVYSYQDIAEAMVVHELDEAGATLRSIKTAINRLRERHGYNWPLQHERLAAHHGQVVGFDGDDAYNLGGDGSEWQRVIAPENLEKIADQLERGGWAVRAIPGLRFIEVNPERLSGRPAIRDRRISAQDAASLAATREGRIVLVDEYELAEDEIRDAERWWEAARRYEAAA